MPPPRHPELRIRRCVAPYISSFKGRALTVIGALRSRGRLSLLVARPPPCLALAWPGVAGPCPPGASPAPGLPTAWWAMMASRCRLRAGHELGLLPARSAEVVGASRRGSGLDAAPSVVSVSLDLVQHSEAGATLRHWLWTWGRVAHCPKDHPPGLRRRGPAGGRRRQIAPGGCEVSEGGSGLFLEEVQVEDSVEFLARPLLGEVHRGLPIR